MRSRYLRQDNCLELCRPIKMLPKMRYRQAGAWLPDPRLHGVFNYFLRRNIK